MIWGVDEEKTGRAAARLVEIGFFEKRGDNRSPTYRVPFMYRPALKRVQGSADGVTVIDEGEDDQEE